MAPNKKKKLRFIDDDGGFKPTKKLKPGTMTIKHLYELMEWIYWHNNKTDKEKMKEILDMEGIVRRMLKDMSSMKINYIPTWSVKQTKRIERKKKYHATK